MPVGWTMAVKKASGKFGIIPTALPRLNALRKKALARLVERHLKTKGKTRLPAGPTPKEAPTFPHSGGAKGTTSLRYSMRLKKLLLRARGRQAGKKP